MGDFSSLLKPRHRFSYLHIHNSVGCYFFQIVLVDYFLWDDFHRKGHILEFCHRGHVVEILYVQAHKFCKWCGYSAVKDGFDGGKTCAQRFCVAFERQSVAAHCHPHPMRFFFVRSQGGYKFAVGYGFVGWYSGPRDEDDGVGAMGHPCSHSLRQPSKVVGECADPTMGVGASGELFVL